MYQEKYTLDNEHPLRIGSEIAVRVKWGYRK